MIAVVGHRDLTAPTLALLEAELPLRLADSARSGRAGLVRAGDGLALAFGRATRSAGMALVAVLPTRAGVPAPLRAQDRRAAGELLLLSEQVRLLEYDPGNTASCVTADEILLTTCARVLAVWDGSPSHGGDATAHLVAFALARDIEVDVLWPAGAGRMSLEGAQP